ncbi:hypothetical protein [Azospira inquinata]|uniref:Transmembrane protein n=1 Tax=Azospira inquinata TaxID=2785627 RepID=A0A975XVH1_9RHOO|nr:hypothetical protein [Azospira inquinata]QWT44849.1 hypothetical protein J8L76_07690 [Azospira inquinata]QWT49819.1 hypothetical protein Azoinq_04190 [Azospira inquinata]
MLLLRLLGILVLLGVGAAVALFLFTRNSRYLDWAWRLFRYALMVALLVFALLVLERLLPML